MASNDTRPVRHLGSIEDASLTGDAAGEPSYDPTATPRPPAVAIDAEPRPEDGRGEPDEPAFAPASESDAQAFAPASESDAQAFAAPSETDAPAPAPLPAFKRTGHPVRDRLLAKAQAAEAESKAERSLIKAPEFSSLGNVEGELQKIASSARPRPNVPLSIGGAPLSSLAVLLLGTVFGLAAFALMFALLIEFAPRNTNTAPLAQGPGATLLPEASATVLALTPPELPPPAPRKKLEGPWRIEGAPDGQRVVRGKIGKDPFLKAIQDAGLDKTQAYRVLTALKGVKDLDHCRPGDEFVALLQRSDGRVLAFEYIVNNEEVYQARTGADGLLKGKQLDLKVERARVQGAIGMTTASFAESARAAHFDPGLGAVIDRAFEGHTSVAEFAIGDRVRVVAQEVTVLGEFSRYAGIEAIEYLPVQGSPLRAYYYPEKKRYYDGHGRAPGEGGWARPVKGAPITSKFNPARMHPILKKKMPHTGTDFGAPTGTPVYAAAGGKIVRLGDYGANGNFIAIEHRGGYETGYSHLSRFEPGLEVLDVVQRKQVIGYVGSTGRSTGPHLHFSAKKDGAFIDPESLGLDALTTLPKGELAVFRQIKEKYDALLDQIELPPAITPPVALAAPSEPLEELDVHVAGMEPEFAEPAGATSVVPAPALGPRSSSAPPEPPPPAPAPVSARSGRTALYLTDKELLQTQAGSAEGEVEE